MSGYMISDRRRIRSIPELDVPDPDLAATLADMPLDKVDSTLEPYVPDPEVPDKVYDMNRLRLHVGEFLKHHSLAADSEGFKKQFKSLLPGVVGDSTLLVMGDLPIATFRRDTKLATKRLEQEQPHIITKYTKMRWVPVFDEEAFKAEMPDVHAAYRGRSFRLKKASSGAGLSLL